MALPAYKFAGNPTCSRDGALLAGLLGPGGPNQTRLGQVAVLPLLEQHTPHSGRKTRVLHTVEDHISYRIAAGVGQARTDTFQVSGVMIPAFFRLVISVFRLVRTLATVSLPGVSAA